MKGVEGVERNKNSLGWDGLNAFAGSNAWIGLSGSPMEPMEPSEPRDLSEGVPCNGWKAVRVLSIEAVLLTLAVHAEKF